MQPIVVRGSRQRSNADHLIKQINDPEKATWLSNEKLVLMVGAPLIKKQVEQWVLHSNLASGTVLIIERWRNDCDCSPDAPIGTRNHCHGHREIVVVDEACDQQKWTLFVDGWKRDKGVDAIVVYAFGGVQIGTQAQP